MTTSVVNLDTGSPLGKVFFHQKDIRAILNQPKAEGITLITVKVDGTPYYAAMGVTKEGKESGVLRPGSGGRLDKSGDKIVLAKNSTPVSDGVNIVVIP